MSQKINRRFWGNGFSISSVCFSIMKLQFSYLSSHARVRHGLVFMFLSIGGQRHEDPGGSMTSQSSQSGVPLVQGETLSQKIRQGNDRGRYPNVSLWPLHTCAWVNSPTHMQRHTSHRLTQAEIASRPEVFHGEGSGGGSREAGRRWGMQGEMV